MDTISTTLRSYHLKATPQRIAIADALDHYGHLSIERLYELMLQKFNSISLATIYKNIHIMVDAAFIQEVKIPHAKSVFEITKSAHSHIVCRECGEIEDITLDLSSIYKEADKCSTFEITDATLVFSGRCQKCQ
jgi:Fur family peroxide stress response transcriptional regulator